MKGSFAKQVRVDLWIAQAIDPNLAIAASENITGATVTIDQNFNSEKDTITYNPAVEPPELNGLYDSLTGVLTVTGSATADRKWHCHI